MIPSSPLLPLEKRGFPPIPGSSLFGDSRLLCSRMPLSSLPLAIGDGSLMTHGKASNMGSIGLENYG